MIARKASATQKKLSMICYGEPFTGKSTFASQFAYMHNEDGSPMRVLYIDCESGSIDNYLDKMESDGVDLNNMLICYTQSLGEVLDLVNKVTNNEDVYYPTEDGDEGDEIVLDADGRPFRADAIVIDGVSVLYTAAQQGLLEFSKKRARVRADNNGLVGDEKIVAIEGSSMEMKDWGTCLWTVADGKTSAQKVLSGEVVVSRDGNKWTIELKSGEGKEMLWTTFTGEIPALTDPGSAGEIKYKELTKVLSVNPYNAGLITLQLATDEVSSEYNPDTRQTTYFGTGNFLALDVYSADGTLAAGTYTACSTGGVVGEGEFGIGYDTEMWGMQFYNWGTCWWTVEDGATSAEKVLDGKLVVSVEDGIYTIALESSTVNAKFVGSLE